MFRTEPYLDRVKEIKIRLENPIEFPQKKGWLQI